MRDSLGRGLDEKSLAAVVASDERVQRELRDRAIYIQSAYRDPGQATARLDDLLSLDGAVSAARRVMAEPGSLGELLGREGAWAGAKARAERRNAIDAASAIGPNLTRTVEAEAQAVKSYRASVEAQIAADRTPIPTLSDRAVAVLGAISGAKTDEERAAAVKALDAEPEIKLDVEAFRKAVDTRFGEEGARAMLRASAAGQSLQDVSVAKALQGALDTATKFYVAVRTGERETERLAEVERLAARQTQGARMKP